MSFKNSGLIRCFLYIKDCLAQIISMRLRKDILRKLLILLAVVVCAFSFTPLTASAEVQKLYLGGFPAGFTLNTTTVEVIGICDVVTKEGMKSPARDCGIKAGDVICDINGEKVTQTSDINRILAKNYKKYSIKINREDEQLSMDINPAVDFSSGSKRLGILVKDSINGIGTVTFIDKTNNKFASLGHPVTDLKNNLIEINGGTVYGCLVYEVKKGVRGTPGELRGAFENNRILGKATTNCPCGIYGDVAEGFDYSKLVEVEKGSVSSAKIGKAYIYTTLNGNTPKRYEISIVKTDRSNKDNRNYVIKIDDEELIEKSGGIVQGMSGSPIIQNGKLIGAVTHVFINDPTRGYGIDIDKMLNSY